MKKNGFTAIEVIMSVAILTMSMLAVSTFTIASSQAQQKTNIKLAVTQVKSHILSLLANESVWRKHIELANNKGSDTDHPLNPELLCLKMGTPCVEGVYKLTIIDQSGKVILNPNDPTQGFTRDGAVCNSYSATNTDPMCPWRLDITWSPTCRPAADGPCTRPQIAIQIQVQASPQFLSSNMMTTTTTVNQLIDQQSYGPPVARTISLVTNSTHYNWGSELSINVAPYTFINSPGNLAIAGPPSQKSRQGGTVTLASGLFKYTPPTGYYGSDYFNYTVTDSYTGLSSTSVVIVKVMTPWTWTGAANDGNFFNPKNFCGRVVAGICDGASLQPGPYAPSDIHVVFNENCTHCDANLSSTISVMTMELGPSYRGKITQNANVNVGSNFNNTWKKTPYFKMSGGTWIGDESSTLSVTPPNTQDPTNEGFYLGGGDFYAPSHLVVQSDMRIEKSSSFHHQNHAVSWTGGYPFGGSFVGDGLTEFYDFNFGIPNVIIPQTYHRLLVKNSFKVLHNTSLSPGDTEASPTSDNNGTKVTLLGDLYLNNTLNAGGCIPGGPITDPLNMVFSSRNDQHIYGQNTALTDGSYSRYICAPMLVVDKPSGNMLFHDFIALRGGLSLVSAGGYDFSGSTLAFAGGAGLPNMILKTNGVPINNLAYDSERAPQAFEIQNNITVNGDFKYRAHWTSSSRPFIVSNVLRSTQVRYLDVKGDVYLSGFSDSGSEKVLYSPVLRMNGTGDQKLVGNQGTTNAVDFLIEIDKNSGLLNMSGSTGIFQQFKITKANMNYAPGTTLHTQPGLSGDIHLYLDKTAIPNLVLNANTKYHLDINVDNLTVARGIRLKSDNSAGNKIKIYKDLNYYGWADSKPINIALAGTGYTQTVNFAKPIGPSYEQFTKNFESFSMEGSNSVNFNGSGKIQNMKIGDNTTVNMTTSTDIKVVDEIKVSCGSKLNQNGATIEGKISACN